MNQEEKKSIHITGLCWTEVLKVFKNKGKTLQWFSVPNPMLGNIAPSEMILRGREEKLLKIIKALKDENGM